MSRTLNTIEDVLSCRFPIYRNHCDFGRIRPFSYFVFTCIFCNFKGDGHKAKGAYFSIPFALKISRAESIKCVVIFCFWRFFQSQVKIAVLLILIPHV